MTCRQFSDNVSLSANVNSSGNLVEQKSKNDHGVDAIVDDLCIAQSKENYNDLKEEITVIRYVLLGVLRKY
jgi:hypothetical protein